MRLARREIAPLHPDRGIVRRDREALRRVATTVRKGSSAVMTARPDAMMPPDEPAHPGQPPLHRAKAAQQRVPHPLHRAAIRPDRAHSGQGTTIIAARTKKHQ